MRKTFDSYFDEEADVPFSGCDRSGVGRSWQSGLLSKAVIDQYRDQHRAGRLDRSYELFAIMMFDLWLARYFGDRLDGVGQSGT